MNYNDLLNKPMVNGKELIGDVPISGLPSVTPEDAGKVPIVGDDGKWTLGTVSGGDSSIKSINNERSSIWYSIRKEINEDE